MTKDKMAVFKKAVGIALLALSSVLLAGSVFAQVPALLQDEPGGPVYMGGEILVQFKADASDDQLLDVFRRGVLTVRRHIQTEAMKAVGHHGVTHMFTGLPVRQAIQALRNHPAVEFVEPNWVYMHQQQVPNDPYFTSGQLWGMYGDASDPANAYGSQAAEAWAAGYTGSGDVIVGVIDEGIQITHPDLAANIWTNPGEKPDGSDNDGNGYVDDINGWDFYQNDNTVYDGPGDDHATHVAGTIGATGGNGIGVVGVNWNIKMISGKFLGPSGGTTADAIEAVDYFTDLKQKRRVNVVALNNSWGGGGFSQALLDAIVRAANQQILFVAAAGNGDWLGRAVNTDSRPFYPACYNTASYAGYDSVISVTAIDSSGNKASWANYGAETVDLGAPGVSIWSTLPTDTYGAYSGTSMATPHVTGAIALYASTHPGATAADIKNAILGSVAATPSLAGKTVTGGRLDLSTVIAPAPSEPPAAPSGLSATAVSSSQINLTWHDNASNESSFQIERSSDGSFYTLIATVGANVTTYSDTGLPASTTYYYRVRASNAAGYSAYTEPASATTQAAPTIPDPPSNLSAEAVSRSQINLSWVDNSDNETGFKIERSTNGTKFSLIATVGANVTSYSNTGLKRNTTYWYRVRAYNDAGDSAYSNTASAKTKQF
jgi:subtilisin family serine protease